MRDSENSNLIAALDEYNRRGEPVEERSAHHEPASNCGNSYEERRTFGETRGHRDNLVKKSATKSLVEFFVFVDGME